MKSEIPNRIFKYRSFDNDGYYRDLLKNNEIYFSSPIKFNDPFDCRVVPNYENGNRRDIYNKIFEYNRKVNPDLSTIELGKITKKFLPALTDRLNEIHNTNRTERYYNIILGSWLFHFIHQAYDKYRTLKEVIKKYLDVHDIEHFSGQRFQCYLIKQFYLA